MTEKIIKKLKKIEKNHNIKILYAVEAGSRGWGFKSPDSDYDIRFIYIHKSEWYLSILEKKDVIEPPIEDLLDISGWDIRKTLRLYSKSNPSLLEWLSSPIIYMQRTSFIDKLKLLTNEYFQSKSCIYHYLHMAEGNYKEYIKKDTGKTKKYLYILRSIMACMWVEKHGTQPPMLFEKLMDSLDLDKNIIDEINSLLIRKKQGKIIGNESPIETINEFIDDKIDYFNRYVKALQINRNHNIEALDRLFRDTLKETWS
ncbi:nucleotidyltransferase domain-containing protein [Dethiothermospora halolimnae]|uniref:nucleotidyltransferase domain-containing protein n=1 Tax=Dethiothermospora halolimnae TaxID=3114390 RepID=UPI003CCC163A